MLRPGCDRWNHGHRVEVDEVTDPRHDLLIDDDWQVTGEIIDVYQCLGCGAEYVSALAAAACCQD